MENHPIPQNITGFQFKLIGQMTVKQFVYLAAGTVLAWFSFFILPTYLIIKLPLALIFLSAGIGLAFVPIDGRPMDIMIINLIKAMLAPTNYIYKKTGGTLSQQPSATMLPQQQPIQSQVTQQSAPAPQTQQATVQPSSPPPPTVQTFPTSSSLQQPQTTNFSTPVPQATPQVQIPPQTTPPTKPTIVGNFDDLVNAKGKGGGEEKKIKELKETKAMENTEANPLSTNVTHQKTTELERLLTETSTQKEALEKELLTLRAKLDGQTKQKSAPPPTDPLPRIQKVRKVPPGLEKTVGLPTAPQDPNLITGMVKDPRGNPLPNILVEVKDSDDNPARAFKTNGLGQFKSATSISNGKYIISLEDPKGKNKFDSVQLEATGAPITPLEIISVDPREELRRELFK